MEDNFKYHSNYDEKSSFSDIVFGAEKPLLETELNEMQQIIGTKLKYLFNVLGSCVNSVYGSESESIFLVNNNVLHVKDCIVTTVDGNIFYVKDESIPITSGYKAFFKVWEEVEDYLSELKEYGNIKGSSVPNKIKDERNGEETTRRTVLKHELMKGVSIPSDTDKVKYIGVGEYTDTGFEAYTNGFLNETNKALLDITLEINRLSSKVDAGLTSGFIELTFDEYCALSEEEKNNGYVYLVPDSVVISQDNIEIDVVDGLLTIRYDDGTES